MLILGLDFINKVMLGSKLINTILGPDLINNIILGLTLICKVQILL